MRKGKGTIEKIWENESRKGNQYQVLVIEGERYSLWDKEYFDQIREGDLVEYTWDQRGDFKNIEALQVLEPEPDLDFREDSNQRRMTRMGCLKYASQITANTHGLEPKDRVEYALEAAQAFESYVLDLERKLE